MLQINIIEFTTLKFCKVQKKFLQVIIINVLFFKRCMVSWIMNGMARYRYSTVHPAEGT